MTDALYNNVDLGYLCDHSLHLYAARLHYLYSYDFFFHTHMYEALFSKKR